MKKLLMLTTTLALSSTAVLAKDTTPVISPEELFQKAKKECPESATTPEGWATIRECISQAKGRILLKDPRIAKVCGKYEGVDRAKCTDRLYLNSDSKTWDPKTEALREDISRRNKPHYDGENTSSPNYTSREHTPGGVIGGKNTSEPRNPHGSRNSNQSTITGTGRGTTTAPPASGKPGGVRLDGSTSREDGNLNGVTAEVETLMRSSRPKVDPTMPKCGDYTFIGPCQPKMDVR